MFIHLEEQVISPQDGTCSDGSNHFSVMFQKWFFVILVPQAVLLHSIQFGVMHHTAVPIFEAEVYSNGTRDVDVVFKQKVSLCQHLKWSLFSIYNAG